MKKLLLAVLVALSATSAIAEPNWVSVIDSDNGTRLLVDSESFAPSTVDDGTVFVGALFKFFADGQLGKAVAFVTEFDNCGKQGGILQCMFQAQVVMRMNNALPPHCAALLKGLALSRSKLFPMRH